MATKTYAKTCTKCGAAFTATWSQTKQCLDCRNNVSKVPADELRPADLVRLGFVKKPPDGPEVKRIPHRKETARRSRVVRDAVDVGWTMMLDPATPPSVRAGLVKTLLAYGLDDGPAAPPVPPVASGDPGDGDVRDLFASLHADPEETHTAS